MVDNPTVEYPDSSEQLRTSFTPEIIMNIINNTQLGLSLKDCAAMVNLPYTQVKIWYDTDKGGFGLAIDNAAAKNKRMHIGRVQKGEDKTKVSASQWWLERKNKEEFSKEVKVIVNHVIKDNMERVVIDVLTTHIKEPERLKAAAEDLRDRLAAIRMDDYPARIASER